MHALVVVAHHDPRSLTHALAARIAEGIVQSGHRAETADLAAEGFDPRFGLADHAVHRGQAAAPAEVIAEQARIDRVDTLVLAYPVYWWSMPALLKGWIERVFSNGWAFEYQTGGELHKKLQRLRVALVGVGGADAGTFERHGYTEAMRTQIDHGIFDYCGAQVVRSELMLQSETTDPAPHLARALAIGRALYAGDARESNRLEPLAVDV